MLNVWLRSTTTPVFLIGYCLKRKFFKFGISSPDMVWDSISSYTIHDNPSKLISHTFQFPFSLHTVHNGSVLSTYSTDSILYP